MRRRALVMVLAAALLFGAAAPAASAAPSERRVCAVRAVLKEAPGGLTIGWVLRGHEVLVLRRTTDRAWVHVRTDFGARGWLLSRALC